MKRARIDFSADFVSELLATVSGVEDIQATGCSWDESRNVLSIYITSNIFEHVKPFAEAPIFDLAVDEKAEKRLKEWFYSESEDNET